MRDHSHAGIRLRLEIVGKTNTYTHDDHRKMQPFASWTTFNSMKVEDSRRVYEGENAFLAAVLVSLYATRCCHLRAGYRAYGTR